MREIWYWFFFDEPETNIVRKLEIIRPLVTLGTQEDITLFNYWAKKAGYPIIEDAEWMPPN